MAIPKALLSDELEPEGLEALGNMNRPIPGQSLTGNPDEPRAWEGPPQFTNMREALDFVVEFMMEEEVFIALTGAVSQGIPISDIVQQILYKGFQDGKWNPDMLLMLVEPLMYIVMAFCEKAGVEFTLYRGEEEDELADPDNVVEDAGDEVKKLQDISNKGTPKIGSVPKDILAKVESIEVPQESLMAKPQPIPTNTDSLLAGGR